MFLSYYFLNDLLYTIFYPTDLMNLFRIAIWGIIPIFIITSRKYTTEKLLGMLLGHLSLIIIYFLCNSSHLMQHEIENYYVMTNTYVILFSIMEMHLKGMTLGKKILKINIISQNEFNLLDYVYRGPLKSEIAAN